MMPRLLAYLDEIVRASAKAMHLDYLACVSDYRSKLQKPYSNCSPLDSVKGT